MTRKSTKPLIEQCEKITSRFSKEHARRIAQQCEETGIRPAVYLRLAGMAFADFKFLDLATKMQNVADEQARLRRDFNDAVYREGE